MSSTPERTEREVGAGWKRLSGGTVAVPAAACVLGIEAILWKRLAAGELGLGSVLLGHVLLSAAVGLAAHRRHRGGGDSRLLVLLAATSWGLGPFAAAGVILVAVLHRWYERVATPFQEWYEALFPEEDETLSQRVYERVRRIVEDRSESPGPTPFADLLRFGSLAERQAVVATVSRHFRPDFAPILRMALQDPANAVRVQAATAISVVESRFSERMQELSRGVDEASSASERAAALLELATLYDDYAFTGLLDAERDRGNRSLAFAAYQRYLALRPEDAEVRLRAGRLLLRDGSYEAAASWFETSFPGGFPDAKSALWYMESLYHLGRFSELREITSRFLPDLEAEDGSFPVVALGAVRFWASAPGAGASCPTPSPTGSAA